MKYDFKCYCTVDVKAKNFLKEECIALEIDCPSSEYYVPDCPKCGKPMRRVYNNPHIVAGVLNGNNIAR